MENARRAVLMRALEIMGNRQSLANSLGVRPVLLDGWLTGGVPVPEGAFLGAVDIIQAEAIGTAFSPASRAFRDEDSLPLFV